MGVLGAADILMKASGRAGQSQVALVTSNLSMNVMDLTVTTNLSSIDLGHALEPVRPGWLA